MIEDTKVVKSIAVKSGGKSGTYWGITWEDGKTDNIFNKDWLSLLKQSQEGQVPLHYTKEKKGNYYNIVSIEVAPPTIAPQEIRTGEAGGDTPIKIKSSPETGMWWKELGDMLRCGDINMITSEGRALRNAYYTEMLRVLGINVQEVLSASYLTEEAKKLGAKEIKKGV